MLIPYSIRPSAKDILEGWLHKHSKILVNANIDTKISIKKKEATNKCKGEEMDIKHEKEFSCNQCYKIFATKKDLWAHNKNCHDVAGLCPSSGHFGKTRAEFFFSSGQLFCRTTRSFIIGP